MDHKWIKDAIKRPGAFTKKAEKRGNLAKTLSKLRKRKKK